MMSKDSAYATRWFHVPPTSRQNRHPGVLHRRAVPAGEQELPRSLATQNQAARGMDYEILLQGAASWWDGGAVSSYVSLTWVWLSISPIRKATGMP
jgi:hypothetical protein